MDGESKVTRSNAFAYNGLSFQSCSWHRSHLEKKGVSYWNYTIGFQLPKDYADMLLGRLLQIGKLLHGLEGSPVLMTSLCHLHVMEGAQKSRRAEWGFWARELTDVELGNERIKELAEAIHA